MKSLSFLPSLSRMIHQIDGYANKIHSEYGYSKLFVWVNYCYCALKYGCNCVEYMTYKFFLLNGKGRKQFLCQLQSNIYEKSHDNERLATTINSKEATLSFFSEYIVRDWVGIRNHNSEEEYKNFVLKHNYCIIKPDNSYGGYGIRITNTAEIDGLPLRAYCYKNNMVAEELVCQHPKLSALFPNSVNTVRLVTKDGRVIGAGLRMGVGTAVVDNSSSGGISAPIDIESGIVASFGERAKGDEIERFAKHPDTGVSIIGFEIPFWKECIDYVALLSRKTSAVSLVAWDISITETGPTLIEANHNPGLWLVQSASMLTISKNSIDCVLYPIIRMILR